jgi:hypothetical protein
VTAELQASLRQWCASLKPAERDSGDLTAFVHAIGLSRRTTQALLSARKEVLRVEADEPVPEDGST